MLKTLFLPKGSHFCLVGLFVFFGGGEGICCFLVLASLSFHGAPKGKQDEEPVEHALSKRLLSPTIGWLPMYLLVGKKQLQKRIEVEVQKPLKC